MAYIILAIGWLGYGATHSLLAALKVKNLIQTRLGNYARYYRIFYNIFATFTLILLLYYQAQIDKIWLWQPSLGHTIGGGALAGIGLGVILAALWQYDLAEFSGLDRLRPTGARKGTLTTTGLSGVVRHPLYTGTLLLIWGLWLFDLSLGTLIMALSLSVYIRVGIYFEEKKLLREFGDSYHRYKQRVPMLFPSLL